jgi:putative redox protein
LRYFAQIEATGVRCRADDSRQPSLPCPVSRVFHDSAGWPAICIPACVQQECALKISLQHTGGARFTAEARHHRVVLDQPAEDGATDQGMSPAELLLASLGGCVGQYVAQYLSTRKLPDQGLSIVVSAQPSARPLRLGAFQVEVVVPGLSDRQLRTLEQSFPAGFVQNAIRFEGELQICAASEPTQKRK